ncbi:hypothetical protein [Geodermatophilus sabuli]|nr:hypothetical protein [Geodermatophilus sabuli]MBB3084675.1 hypothetical protein [Geodermatophilus sabuli]
MAQPTRVPLPADDYLTRIGQLVYMVGHLEWGVLGDLSALGNPGGLSVDDLAGQSTGAIAQRLTAAVAKISDPDIQQFIATAGQALSDLASRRNGVMHSRPATAPDGQQTLYRWTAGPKPAAEAYIVDRTLLDQLIADIDSWSSKVTSLRHAARAAASSPLGQ